MDEEEEFFSLKLVYDGHDKLVSAALNGKPMELFDILNPDGSKTGIVRERGVAHREGSLHATAHIWVVRKNHKSGYDVCCFKREALARIPIQDVMTSRPQAMWLRGIQ